MFDCLRGFNLTNRIATVSPTYVFATIHPNIPCNVNTEQENEREETNKYWDRERLLHKSLPPADHMKLYDHEDYFLVPNPNWAFSKEVAIVRYRVNRKLQVYYPVYKNGSSNIDFDVFKKYPNVDAIVQECDGYIFLEFKDPSLVLGNYTVLDKTYRLNDELEREAMKSTKKYDRFYEMIRRHNNYIREMCFDLLENGASIKEEPIEREQQESDDEEDAPLIRSRKSSSSSPKKWKSRELHQLIVPYSKTELIDTNVDSLVRTTAKNQANGKTCFSWEKKNS